MIYKNRRIRVHGKTVIKDYRWNEEKQRFEVVAKTPVDK